MADLTPEVIDALVRLMNDDTQLDKLDDDALLVAGRMGIEGTELAGRVAATLNARGGWPFAKIAQAWGVHEATVWRWAKAHGRENAPTEQAPEPEPGA